MGPVDASSYETMYIRLDIAERIPTTDEEFQSYALRAIRVLPGFMRYRFLVLDNYGSTYIPVEFVFVKVEQKLLSSQSASERVWEYVCTVEYCSIGISFPIIYPSFSDAYRIAEAFLLRRLYANDAWRIHAYSLPHGRSWEPGVPFRAPLRAETENSFVEPSSSSTVVSSGSEVYL